MPKKFRKLRDRLRRAKPADRYDKIMDNAMNAKRPIVMDRRIPPRPFK